MPVTLHVIEPIYGGAGTTKAKHHRDQMELVAQLFLEAGCKFPKVNQLVEDLMTQVGPSRLQYLTRCESSEVRMSKFEELCANANITLPAKNRSKASADNKFRRLQLQANQKQQVASHQIDHL